MSQEDRISVSLSGFLKDEKAFCFMPLGKGCLVRAPSCVPVWSHGQVSLYSWDPQNSPQALFFSIGAFDVILSLCCLVVWEGLCGWFSLWVLSSLKLGTSDHNPNLQRYGQK